MTALKTVGFILFNGVERLDFEGPMGVLGWAARHSGQTVQLVRVSKDGNSVKDHLHNTTIQVDAGFDDVGQFDLCLVPGGDTNHFVNDEELIEGVKKLGDDSGLLASVCTGAFLVAAAGLADKRSIATHWLAHDRFESMFPGVNLVKDKRFVVHGNLWSSAGISAGIDMTLHLVSSVYGETIAKKSQGLLEYFPEAPWSPEEVAQALSE